MEKEKVEVLEAENQELKDRIVELQAVIIQTGQRALNAENQLLSIQRANLQPQLMELQAREAHLSEAMGSTPAVTAGT